ncbi:MAG: hypothetical protein K2G88_07695 [Oscillospiraceae bacterium]|nr:hypothetical protein [Oscillospiraceae bacterium]
MNEYKKYASGQPSFEIYSVETALKFAPSFLRQLEITEDVMKNTPNPETFFHRFGYAMFLLTELVKMEDIISFEKELPSEHKQKLMDKKQEYIRNLLDNIFDRLDKKISKLKTQKSIIGNIERLGIELKIYEVEMSEETISYMKTVINNLKKNHEIDFGAY